MDEPTDQQATVVATQRASTYFRIISDREGGVTFRRFCDFLAYCRVLDFDFDHSHALEVYLQVTEGDIEKSLDEDSFLSVLQAFAARRYDQERDSWAALRRLLNDMEAGHNFDLKVCSGPLHGLLYNEELIRATYAFAGALHALFLSYTTITIAATSIIAPPGTSTDDWQESPSTEKAIKVGNPTVTARSAYRLFRALGIVPSCVWPGELLDIAADFILGHEPDTPERRYFEDESMISGDETSDWTTPIHNAIDGEPCYSFPEFLELLVAAALCMPPRVLERPSERPQRIQEVLENLLKLPRDHADFDAVEYLHKEGRPIDDEFGDTAARAVSLGTSLGAVSRFPGLSRTLGGTKNGRPKRELDSEGIRIWSWLHAELPYLPEAQDQYGLPRPAPGQPLVQRAPPLEDLLATRKGRSPLVAWRSLAVSNKAEEKRHGPKPKPPPVPPELRHDRLSDQLDRLASTREAERRRLAALAGPATGWVVRLTLILEPLRAPSCAESEEVLTLIETALTSRRLRKYDVAISCLIRARRQWAAIAAGKEVPESWADIEPQADVHSPWDDVPLPSVQTATGATAVPTEKNDSELQSDASRAGLQEEGSKGGDLGKTIAPWELSWREAAATADEEAQGEAPDEEAPPVVRSEGQELRFEVPASEPSKSSPPPLSALPSQGTAAALLAARAGRHARVVELRYDPAEMFEAARGDADRNLHRLQAEVNLFFLYELASLHSAINEEELATKLLWRARAFSDSLPSSHPDTAVVWSGLGVVAYRTGRFELAARSMARALRIREGTIGSHTVETATSHNNLACCLVELDRALEATTHLELATELLLESAGTDHPRTQTAMRNLEKARSNFQDIRGDMPHLFFTPVVDRFGNLRATKRKKSKKGDKGSTLRSFRSTARR